MTGVPHHTRFLIWILRAKPSTLHLCHPNALRTDATLGPVAFASVTPWVPRWVWLQTGTHFRGAKVAPGLGCPGTEATEGPVCRTEGQRDRGQVSSGVPGPAGRGGQRAPSACLTCPHTGHVLKFRIIVFIFLFKRTKKTPRPAEATLPLLSCPSESPATRLLCAPDHGSLGGWPGPLPSARAGSALPAQPGSACPPARWRSTWGQFSWTPSEVPCTSR